MSKTGSIYFDVKLDEKDAEQKLGDLQDKIKTLQDQLNEDSAESAKSWARADQLSEALDRARQKLEEMKAAGKGAYAPDEIAAQKETVKDLEGAWGEVVKHAEYYQKSAEKAKAGLESAKTEAAQLEKYMQQAANPANRLRQGFANAGKGAEALKVRVQNLVKSMLFFQVISKLLAAFRDYMGDVVAANAEASAAIGQLKGALLTLAQPLISVLIPAFITLLQVLTAVAAQAAKLLSALFGTTAKDSANAAASLNKETKALKGTGAAAKKASGALASFDEINKLTDSSASAGGGGADALSGFSTPPDFSFLDEIDERLQRIAKAVLLIAAGLALWKLAQNLPGILGTLLTKLGGILIAVGGLILLWEGLKDAWENGIDWKNAAMMVGGLAAAAGGLALAFGPVAAGIALVAGGIALLITGFADATKNGWDLQNAFVSIAGIIATGLGISLLTGSMIPLLVAGIASILLAITLLTGNGGQMIDNLKQLFGGLKDFVVKIAQGDIPGAFEGLKKAGKGLVNFLLTVFGSFVNALIKGLNWLIDKINSIGFTAPDWVPLIGGKTMKFNLPKAKAWPIPQLAQGAVIPPNREFLAMLGDQRSGTNIEAPLETIKQAMAEVMGEYGGGDVEVTVYVGDEKLTDHVVKRINRKTRASGKPVLV